jgi:hypothetical protein
VQIRVKLGVASFVQIAMHKRLSRAARVYEARAAPVPGNRLQEVRHWSLEGLKGRIQQCEPVSGEQGTRPR